MQNWDFSKTVLRLMALVGVLAGMLTILGCPGDEEEVRAAINPTIQATSTSVKAIDDRTFTFPSGAPAVFPGFPALATQPTTVTIDSTPATPVTTVVATAVRGTDGNPARYTASTTFGSCIFVVLTSTFSPGPPPAGPQVGQRITVDPCEVSTRGTIEATGQATTVDILLKLGPTPSAPQQAQVSIDPTTVTLSIGGVSTGQTVVLQLVTGAAGVGG